MSKIKYKTLRRKDTKEYVHIMATGFGTCDIPYLFNKGITLKSLREALTFPPETMKQFDDYELITLIMEHE